MGANLAHDAEPEEAKVRHFVVVWGRGLFAEALRSRSRGGKRVPEAAQAWRTNRDASSIDAGGIVSTKKEVPTKPELWANLRYFCMLRPGPDVAREDPHGPPVPPLAHAIAAGFIAAGSEAARLCLQHGELPPGGGH